MTKTTPPAPYRNRLLRQLWRNNPASPAAFLRALWVRQGYATVSLPTFRRWLRESGRDFDWEVRRRNQLIYELYEEGLTQTEIVAELAESKFRTNKSTVGSVLVRNDMRRSEEISQKHQMIREHLADNPNAPSAEIQREIEKNLGYRPTLRTIQNVRRRTKNTRNCP